MFYRWYARYLTEGADGLVNRGPIPKIIWKKMPHDIRTDLHNMVLDEPELSPRELAVTETGLDRNTLSLSSANDIYRVNGCD